WVVGALLSGTSDGSAVAVVPPQAAMTSRARNRSETTRSALGGRTPGALDRRRVTRRRVSRGWFLGRQPDERRIDPEDVADALRGQHMLGRPVGHHPAPIEQHEPREEMR